MGFFIPQDVSNYIFIFLFFSSSFEKLFCLSKFTTKGLKNTYEYKKYKEFMEIVEMLREDKTDYSKHEQLEKKWLYYNLNRWPFFMKNISNNIYKIGDFVDAKDFLNVWCPAKIIKIHKKYKFSINKENRIMITTINNIYEVEFMGWSSNFNEKLDCYKISKLSTYTTSPFDKMRNFYRNDFKKFWCLIKKPKEKCWRMEKITDRIIDLSKNKILIYTESEIMYQIDKDTVDDCILPISNALCFLARKNVHTFNYSNRTFYL
jgi:hypothetical protein